MDEVVNKSIFSDWSELKKLCKHYGECKGESCYKCITRGSDGVFCTLTRNCAICKSPIPEYYCHNGEALEMHLKRCFNEDCFYWRLDWEWEHDEIIGKGKSKERRHVIDRYGKCTFKVNYHNSNVCKSEVCRDIHEWWIRTPFTKARRRIVDLEEEDNKRTFVVSEYLRHAANHGGKLWTRKRMEPRM